jgi:hypothetical protein
MDDGARSAAVEVAVLGPVELVDGTSVVRLPRAERTLLAALAARRGQRVPVEVLADAVWPDGQPATARKAIQGHIFRRQGATCRWLDVAQGGVRVLVPDAVDLPRGSGGLPARETPSCGVWRSSCECNDRRQRRHERHDEIRRRQQHRMTVRPRDASAVQFVEPERHPGDRVVGPSVDLIDDFRVRHRCDLLMGVHRRIIARENAATPAPSGREGAVTAFGRRTTAMRYDDRT